jgi:phosphoenolpyruvate synthase/pyruvate phosphate dikinase
MVDVARLPADAIRFVGAKAAQMGRLCEIEGITTPGGFAIPFAAYLAHLESAGLDIQIGAMLSNVEFIGNTAVRAQQLSHLRAAIVAHPVDPNLLATLMERIRSLGGGRRLILRSSTNAEDLDGFNGAGLYESIEVVADPTSDQVAAALRQVWASVWLQRAFEEREWYRIDHRAVAMGVLVQPFVHDAVATGVAITGNPFKQGLDAVFINTQVSGSTVTGALDNQLPEQYLVATWAGAYEPELLSRSSLTQGAAILGNTELQELTTQLLRIHRIMLAQKTGSANAMDVEFALTAQRHFVVLQARPYTIVYSLDRATRPRRDVSLTERVMGRLRKLAHRLRTACSSRNGTKRSLAALQCIR